MTDREKLIEILRVPIYPHLDADPAEVVADYLLDNGVTVQLWIPVTERLPETTGKYLVAKDGVHGSTIGTNWYFVPCPPDGMGGWNSEEIITHWMPLPEPPKEDRNVG